MVQHDLAKKLESHKSAGHTLKLTDRPKKISSPDKNPYEKFCKKGFYEHLPVLLFSSVQERVIKLFLMKSAESRQ